MPASAAEGVAKPFISAVTAFLVCTLVWVLTNLGDGDFGHFWPGWVSIPVLITGVQAITSRRR